MTWILAGDIGRKTTLRLVNTEAGGRTYEYRDRSLNHTSLLDMVTTFLDDVEQKSGTRPLPHKACFAVAGLVTRNSCELVNIPWSPIIAEQLQQELNINQIDLINDFTGVGYGVVALKNRSPSDLYRLQELNNSTTEGTERIAIIGAGTGLGVAFVINKNNAKDIVVYPSEGGHANFPLCGQLDSALEDFLQREYPSKPVEVEQVVRGKGIVDIYRFLLNSREGENLPEITKLVETAQREAKSGKKTLDPAAEIAKAALSNSPNKLCQKTMEIFIEAYATAASNLAITFLPYGGLYIAGSIAPKILPLFRKLDFLKAFDNKGHKPEDVGRKVLSNIPVYVVLNPNVGLVGAQYYAEVQL